MRLTSKEDLGFSIKLLLWKNSVLITGLENIVIDEAVKPIFLSLNIIQKLKSI